MYVFLCLACALPAFAGENIALGRPYVLFPPPNYPLCTDDGDEFQLTDGKFSTSHWTRKSTVGWHHPQELPQITIDLEQVCTVDRVEIRTAAGRHGGVRFPSYAVVLISLDGISFQVAGYAVIPEEIMVAGQQKNTVSLCA